MLNITLITVGKIKEKYFTDAIGEYSKRLSRYCKLNIIELKDEPTPDNPSQKETDIILDTEGERIISKIPKGAFIIPLCIEGKKVTSTGFSDLIERTASMGKSEIAFIIGGSMGLSNKVKGLADFKLSFSDMTFPHQLMRVILLEQLYRAFNISEGGKYHK